MNAQTATINHEATRLRAIEGVLLGTAVGDALGLPAENLSPGRIRRMWNGNWRMRFLFRHGMVSDDTEHTLLVAQALLQQHSDAKKFRRVFAWKMRWWFAGLPGGVGLATAKACLKLWIGFSPAHSAVKSGGSGPAMRSAILGAYFSEDAEKRREFVLASSRLTHRGWQAETAALAVAEAAAVAATNALDSVDSRFLIEKISVLSSEPEWRTIIEKIKSSLADGFSVAEFVRCLGLENGVSGYSLHVVSVALYAWLLHKADFRSALCAGLDCGGDTDTVGAILGALFGASCGPQAIPREWIESIWDWPRSIDFMREVSQKLADQRKSNHELGAVRYFWPGVVLRNLVFLIVVLFHGFRRLLPPY